MQLLKIVYYLSFAWLLVLVIAEISALVFPHYYIFTTFLNVWFFTWITYLAIAFVVVRFVVIMATDLRQRR